MRLGSSIHPVPSRRAHRARRGSEPPSISPVPPLPPATVLISSRVGGLASPAWGVCGSSQQLGPDPGDLRVSCYIQFHAMDTLHKSVYDVAKAISALVPQGGPVLCRDEMEEWSASEASLFEEALEKYGKDFTDIQQDFVSATWWARGPTPQGHRASAPPCVCGSRCQVQGQRLWASRWASPRAPGTDLCACVSCWLLLTS